MAIEYINATRRRGKRQRGGGYTPKKGLFSMGVFSYQCTALLTVALVIRATDSLFPLKCSIIESRNNPINVATPDVLTHAEAANNHKRGDSNGSFC